MPTLVIHGDKDLVNPFDETGKRMAAAIPGSALKVYEDGPHGLVITHRDRLSRDLLDFIRS